jgi:hypothetical protein
VSAAGIKPGMEHSGVAALSAGAAARAGRGEDGGVG